MTGKSELVGYFGYGSLVNRATLRTRIVSAHPARLAGWRRYWRRHAKGTTSTGGFNPAVLTAGQQEGRAIDGMLIVDRRENLAAVDEREHRYHRVEISRADLHFYDEMPPLEFPLYVYEARFEEETDHPSHIVRTYLDAVMQGFYRAFGSDGLQRFVAETDAFHHPIHEDREAPFYPRAVILEEDEKALIEDALSRICRNLP